MKRALIAIASVGILASAGWVGEANAQQMAPASPPSQAYAPAPAYRNGPSRRYARRAYRRSARQNYRTPTATNYGTPPATYAGNTAFTPGAGPPPYAVSTQSYGANSAQPNEWYAAPGPNRRGNMCITHTDSLRGYGFQAPCK
jgi:hypothetical protein